MLQPSTGQVLWNRADVYRNARAIRRCVGYLPQQFELYPHLMPKGFLTYLASLKGLGGRAGRSRIELLLESTGLNEFRSVRMGELSGGIRKRIGIAQALLHDPQLLIVDEPVAGLDTEERHAFTG